MSDDSKLKNLVQDIEQEAKASNLLVLDAVPFGDDMPTILFRGETTYSDVLTAASVMRAGFVPVDTLLFDSEQRLMTSSTELAKLV